MERLDVRLRRLRVGDSAMVLRWRNSPEVGEHMITNHTITREEHEAWLRRVLDADDCRYWVICVDDQPAGLVSIVDIDRERGCCRWGFYTAEVRMRGRGVATAALTSALDHVFGELGLDVVEAEVLASNVASLALHRRLGFELVDRVPGAVSRAGREIDAVTLRLRADDWRRRGEGA